MAISIVISVIAFNVNHIDSFECFFLVIILTSLDPFVQPSTTQATTPTTVTFRPITTPVLIAQSCLLPFVERGSLFSAAGHLLDVSFVAPNEAVILRCDPGFSANGPRSSVCINGTFRPDLGQCTVPGFPCNIPVIQNGSFYNSRNEKLSTKTIDHGDIVYLGCDRPDLFDIEGNYMVTCDNGVFTPKLGRCVRTFALQLKYLG